MRWDRSLIQWPDSITDTDVTAKEVTDIIIIIVIIIIAILQFRRLYSWNRSEKRETPSRPARFKVLGITVAGEDPAFSTGLNHELSTDQ